MARKSASILARFAAHTLLTARPPLDNETREPPRMNRRALAASFFLFAVNAGAAPAAGDCPPDADLAVAPVAAAVRSATVFSQAPGVAAFAKAWTRKFAGCVRSAAGSDGRLSMKEAERLAE